MALFTGSRFGFGKDAAGGGAGGTGICVIRYTAIP